jgi:predicted enzyme related to lactoylglutathione lyase
VGRFIWYELITNDVDGAKAFYTSVMGWGVERFAGSDAFEGGIDYFIWKAGAVGVGGVMKMADTPPAWLAYVYVDDVDATLARALKLGAEVAVPGTDIPNVGRFGVLADPQGAHIAVMRPTPQEEQPERPMTMRGNVGWHELSTTDSKSALAFYSALFGWQPATSMDMGEYGTYSIFRHGADAGDVWLGGASDMAQHMGMPAHWLYYVNVDAMDAALERIKAGGGQVINGPTEVPGGRAAVCADPQGAVFGVFAHQ